MKPIVWTVAVVGFLVASSNCWAQQPRRVAPIGIERHPEAIAGVALAAAVGQPKPTGYWVFNPLYTDGENGAWTAEFDAGFDALQLGSWQHEFQLYAFGSRSGGSGSGTSKTTGLSSDLSLVASKHVDMNLVAGYSHGGGASDTNAGGYVRWSPIDGFGVQATLQRAREKADGPSVSTWAQSFRASATLGNLLVMPSYSLKNDLADKASWAVDFRYTVPGGSDRKTWVVTGGGQEKSYTIGLELSLGQFAH